MYKVWSATTGYTYKFLVKIAGVDVIFEPDEERNYRTIIPVEYTEHLKAEDKEAIYAIGERLQSLI